MIGLLGSAQTSMDSTKILVVKQSKNIFALSLMIVLLFHHYLSMHFRQTTFKERFHSFTAADIHGSKNCRIRSNKKSHPLVSDLLPIQANF